jgi:hypothetical protein
MPSVRFEPAIAAGEWPHIHAKETGLINSYGIKCHVECCFTVPGIRQCFTLAYYCRPSWLVLGECMGDLLCTKWHCSAHSPVSSALPCWSIHCYSIHIYHHATARLGRRLSMLCLLSLRWEGFIAVKEWKVVVKLSLCMLWRHKGKWKCSTPN